MLLEQGFIYAVANLRGGEYGETWHRQGHLTNTERIEQTVDVYAFLFERLGIEYRSIRQKPRINGVEPRIQTNN